MGVGTPMYLGLHAATLTITLALALQGASSILSDRDDALVLCVQSCSGLQEMLKGANEEVLADCNSQGCGITCALKPLWQDIHFVFGACARSLSSIAGTFNVSGDICL